MHRVTERNASSCASPEKTVVDSWQAVLLIAGLVAIALNQRPALVAVGPLTAQLRAETGMGASATSLLTTLPLLCFGVFALLAPVLGRRIGLDGTLAVALTVLTAGIALRLVPSVAALFVGSAVAGAGIAISNVLLPGVIKRDFPDHTGLAMGMYSLLLNGGAALASGATVPLGTLLHTGWRTTLALWGLLAIAAMVFWVPRALRSQQVDNRTETRVPIRVWRSRLAWAVAGYMALQSLVYYALIAWLPTVLKDAGLSESRAGFMAAVMSTFGIGASFVVPVIATKIDNQRPLVLVSAMAFLLGLAGLLAAPVAGVWAWMVLLGIGQGAGIGLALTLFVLRSTTSSAAAQLSGMAQTVGYLVAATGPLTVGVLHDITRGWTLPVAALIAALAALLTVGWVAAANRTVENDPR
jgi:CP family cyanate transporter-like MFS transporter